MTAGSASQRGLSVLRVVLILHVVALIALRLFTDGMTSATVRDAVANVSEAAAEAKKAFQG